MGRWKPSATTVQIYSLGGDVKRIMILSVHLELNLTLVVQILCIHPANTISGEFRSLYRHLRCQKLSHIDLQSKKKN